jgi:hypothetical protein
MYDLSIYFGADIHDSRTDLRKSAATVNPDWLKPFNFTLQLIMPINPSN